MTYPQTAHMLRSGRARLGGSDGRGVCFGALVAAGDGRKRFDVLSTHALESLAIPNHGDDASPVALEYERS